MSEKTPRQIWMSVLARATRAEVEAVLAKLAPDGVPDHAILKPAEVGAIMVEGRAGGTGRRFNLGEATVARCVIQLAEGAIGHAYALGRDTNHAHASALVDALLQGDQSATGFDAHIRPLAEKQAAARTETLRKAAATKVDFFTMVRGDG